MMFFNTFLTHGVMVNRIFNDPKVFDFFWFQSSIVLKFVLATIFDTSSPNQIHCIHVVEVCFLYNGKNLKLPNLHMICHRLHNLAN